MLDIGSGPNYLAVKPIIATIKKTIKLTATDMDPSSLNSLHELLQKEEHTPLKSVIPLDMNLPEQSELTSNSFDVVMASLVLHQLNAPHEAIRHLVKLTRPGGIIINPDAGKGVCYQPMLIPGNSVDREGHLTHYSLHDFGKTAIEMGEKLKIAFPLIEHAKCFPSEAIPMLQLIIYRVSVINKDKLNNLQTLWQNKQYKAAFNLVFLEDSKLKTG